MHRRLVIPTLLAVAALLGAGVAQGELSQKGNLRISFDGNFSPRSLPRDRPAPVTVSVEGRDRNHRRQPPAAVRRIEIALNRHGRLSSHGPAGLHQPVAAVDQHADRPRTLPAGAGRAWALRRRSRVPKPGPDFRPTARYWPSTAGSGGKPALLLHLYMTTPVQTTFVLPLKISRNGKGQFGTVLSAQIPTLAGGLGSVTEIDLKIGREYTYRGQPRSYISASCAAPAGFPGAVFPLAKRQLLLRRRQEDRHDSRRDCHVR